MTNSETFCDADPECANMFPPPCGAGGICGRPRLSSLSWQQLECWRRWPILAKLNGTKTDRTVQYGMHAMFPVQTPRQVLPASLHSLTRRWPRTARCRRGIAANRAGHRRRFITFRQHVVQCRRASANCRAYSITCRKSLLGQTIVNSEERKQLSPVSPLRVTVGGSPSTPNSGKSRC